MRRFQRLLVFAVLPVLLVLSGCMSVPASSLWPLSRIDMTTTQSALLRVAVRLPPGLRVHTGGVLLDVGLATAGQPDRKLSLPLQEVTDSAETGSVPEGPPSTVATVYRLADPDVARLDAFRADGLRMKVAGHRMTLTIGISATGFCRTPAPVTPPLLITTYLKTVETGRFVPMLSNIDLAQSQGGSAFLAGLAHCLSSVTGSAR